MAYPSATPQRRFRTLGLQFLLAAILLGGSMLAGCDEVKIETKNAVKLPEPNSISAGELARRLNMTVTHSSGSMVTLRSVGNSVLLYADPCGQAYVNGKPMGDGRGIHVAADTLHVPLGLESTIRRALRDEPGPIIIPPKPPPGRDPRKVVKASGKVVIDPGHGGKDSGTNPGAARPEKAVNLAVANRVVELLRERGVNAVGTRTDDHFVELDDRIDKANNMGADLFVSIHADYSENPTIDGHTVITPRVYSSKANMAANYISQRMRTAGSPKHGVRSDYRRLRVLERARVPALLVEMGFLSNREDAARLCDAACQQQIAEAIADGVCDYLRSK